MNKGGVIGIDLSAFGKAAKKVITDHGKEIVVTAAGVAVGLGIAGTAEAKGLTAQQTSVPTAQVAKAQPQMVSPAQAEAVLGYAPNTSLTREELDARVKAQFLGNGPKGIDKAAKKAFAKEHPEKAAGGKKLSKAEEAGYKLVGKIATGEVLVGKMDRKTLMAQSRRVNDALKR